MPKGTGIYAIIHWNKSPGGVVLNAKTFLGRD